MRKNFDWHCNSIFFSLIIGFGGISAKSLLAYSQSVVDWLPDGCISIRQQSESTLVYKHNEFGIRIERHRYPGDSTFSTPNPIPYLVWGSHVIPQFFRLKSSSSLKKEKRRITALASFPVPAVSPNGSPYLRTRASHSGNFERPSRDDPDEPSGAGRT